MQSMRPKAVPTVAWHERLRMQARAERERDSAKPQAKGAAINKRWGPTLNKDKRMVKSHSLGRMTWRVVGFFAIVAVPATLLAQPPQRGARLDPNAITDTDKRPYDKHDFSGLWARNPQTYGLPECAECRDTPNAPGYGFFGTPPPRTSEGEKRFQANKPGRGYELNSKEANAHPEVDMGYRRAVLPAFGNDPEARCEPLGLARNITFSGGGATMERR